MAIRTICRRSLRSLFPERNCISSNSCCYCSTSEVKQLNIHIQGERPQNSTEKKISEGYRKAMRNVPQPVVVVTAADYDPVREGWLKRGVTCGSFTSVSLQPPIISFCINRPSRMHDLLLKTKHFAVHVLAIDQVRFGVHFSKPALDGVDQFEQIPHKEGIKGTPIIANTSAVLECEAHCVHTVGDHCVWYGEVTGAEFEERTHQPLLYFVSSYRSIGDEIFLKAFEDATLPFEDWTHKAHLRMAWNYIREYGQEKATPFIKKGILKYNEQNKEKIKYGYHETVTMFYIHLLAEAIRRGDNPEETFEEFMHRNQELTESSLVLSYYSQEKLADQDYKLRFLPPDKKELPGF